MNNYFIVPGIGNSGEQHWQTYFENTGQNFVRINQKEWDAPLREDWVNTLQNAIAGYDPASVILIAHSLACATVAYWARKYTTSIKGAMLVSPSDTEALNYTFPAKGFSPMPVDMLPFKSIVVASNNDEWVTINRAEYFAGCWGSQFINIGDAGHINASSGYGPWDVGLQMLQSLE